MKSASALTPLRCLVVDDEELARNLLATLVRRDAELELVGECTNGVAALAALERVRPDLMLLDVQMPLMNGLEVVERCAADGRLPYVVFVTAHDDYAIRAFELNALDYLVKPVEKARFQKSIARAKQAIRQRELCALTRRMLAVARDSEGRRHPELPAAGAIVVRKGDELVTLLPEDIVWVEAANQYVNLHTRRGEFVMAESLSAFARRLDAGFLRIHRSAIVNLDRVARVLRKRGGLHVIELDSGARLQLARSRKDLLPALLRKTRAQTDA